MVSRRTNFGERSEPAPDRGGKLQSAGGAAQSNVSPLVFGLQDFNHRICCKILRQSAVGLTFLLDQISSHFLHHNSCGQYFHFAEPELKLNDKSIENGLEDHNFGLSVFSGVAVFAATLIK